MLYSYTYILSEGGKSRKQGLDAGLFPNLLKRLNTAIHF